MAQREVLGHGEAVHQPEVLVHHAHPVLEGLLGRGEVHPLPVQMDLAAVGMVEAGQDRAQRRLAGAVLTQQGVYLAPAQVEVDPVVGRDPEEALGYGVEARCLLGFAPGTLTGLWLCRRGCRC